MKSFKNGDLVELDLVGVDSHAFAIMGTFQGAAKRQGFPMEEIQEVLTEAKSGDYDHLTLHKTGCDGYVPSGSD